MAESLQHKLDRVRRPRVQITYDVETGGAMEKTELPFVVGVMADLSAQPKEALRPVKERKFTPIDRDNFNEVLEKATPRLAMKVQNRLTGDDTRLAVELNFKNMDDFEPTRVAGLIEQQSHVVHTFVAGPKFDRAHITRAFNRNRNHKIAVYILAFRAEQVR